MPTDVKTAPAITEVKTGEEMKKIEYEPMLPIEYKLIQYSLALGVILLVVLVWLSYSFFPAK